MRGAPALKDRKSKWFSGALWGNGDFLKLWGGLSLSYVGTAITGLALPTIAIVSLNAGPTVVGLLKAAETIAFPVLGLVAGVLADRSDPRRLMIMADVARFLALLSIPLFTSLGWLNMTQLFVVAAISGVFSVLFNVSFMTLVPNLVPREDLVEGNAKLTLSYSAGQVVGPAVASGLLETVGAAKAVAVDAFSYLVSALALAAIRKPFTPRTYEGARPSFLFQIKEGLQFVFRQPVLRQLTFVSACVNLGFSAIQAILLVFAYNNLGLSPQHMGLVFSAGSVGLVLGSMLAGHVSRWFGLGRSLLVVPLLMGLSLGAIPLAMLGAPLAVISLLWLLGCLALPIYDVNQVSLRQSLTPPEMQGRMNASMRTLIWGAVPIGSVVGGVLVERVSPAAGFLFGGGVITAAALLVLAGPVFSLKRPQDVQQSQPAS